jgi:hypothetical protein
MTKTEISEMLDDMAAYSGHVLGFGPVRKAHHGSINGTVRTSLGRFRFHVMDLYKHERHWTIHFESATASLENGGLGYEAYIVPRFRAHPGLREKVISANFIIETLTSSQKLYEVKTYQDALRSHYKVVGMPSGLSRRDRVQYCLEKIKRAHLPSTNYQKN